MATFVLIAGAWHGSWCWEDLLPHLSALGHSALAPELPGMGSDGTFLAGRDVLTQWTDAVAASVNGQAGRVVLVGHSRGGILASTVAERLPDRIALAVYLSAPLLRDGEAAAEAGFLSEELTSAFVPNAAGTAVAVDPARAGELLYGDLPPALAARAVARLTDEPIQPSSARLRLSADRFGRVARAYVETTRDRAAPLAAQREMQGRWPCDAVASLPCGHASFYAMPQQLAETLDGLVRRAGPRP